MFRRAQISTEYLIIVGFVVFLVISVLGVALFYTSGSQDQIRFSTLEQFANTIVTNAEEVYYAGEPSLRTVDVYMPQGVTSVSVETNALVFNISSGSGLNVVSFPSDVPLGGSISSSEGLKRLKIVAQPTRSYISEGS